ncbi:hypothetical protein A2870_00520 [Candidatus Curtissbacteria bacterium RIFCSPHIGHO2_01_FULL_41_11]|uniref:Uncharacterized protein n=1 Tax=Candidatus Curtissbacteria bacterium RIFCSPHIGHO2_01_FULL_41_11 TaxID=1797711 RepID=A0A1F5G873_9BACT|nr:MAG: hypothetical protein A2870_00520 [Candidatus Curtissbacteria bacterium RIFCSPHIGHO2_01_FULL_41_11]
MAERKSKPKDTLLDFYNSSAERVLSDTDNLYKFFAESVEDFIKARDPLYRKSFRIAMFHGGERLRQRHDQKVEEVLQTVDPILIYLAELATGKEPSTTPTERQVRVIFGVLAQTLLYGNDYHDIAINRRIRDRSLAKASLAHADGNKDLAAAYASLPVQKSFLRAYNLYTNPRR